MPRGARGRGALCGCRLRPARGAGPLTLNRDASFLDLAPPAPGAAQVRLLDRYTTFSVVRRPGEPFYRLRLLSWFVEARGN